MTEIENARRILAIELSLLALTDFLKRHHNDYAALAAESLDRVQAGLHQGDSRSETAVIDVARELLQVNGRGDRI